jgi:hypothetical protein
MAGFCCGVIYNIDNQYYNLVYPHPLYEKYRGGQKIREADS